MIAYTVQPGNYASSGAWDFLGFIGAIGLLLLVVAMLRYMTRPLPQRPGHVHAVVHEHETDIDTMDQGVNTPSVLPTPRPGSMRWEEPADAPVVYHVVDPCDHHYQELPLTPLLAHLYESHFEVWNMVADRDPPPARWRKEHEVEHGVRAR